MKLLEHKDEMGRRLVLVAWDCVSLITNLNEQIPHSPLLPQVLALTRLFSITDPVHFNDMSRLLSGSQNSFLQLNVAE